MYGYLDLNLPRGTSKVPHIYLNNIARHDYISLLRHYFFNEHTEKKSLYFSFDIDVKEDKNLLILNYEVEVKFISEFEPPVKEWRSKSYKFENSLASTLQIELLHFIRNIDKHFKKGKEEKSIKAFVKKLIGIITERYTRVKSSPSHIKYLTYFEQFFSAVALKVHQDYYAFLPKRYDSIFTSLISFKDVTTPLVPASLQVSIFDAIKELKDDKGRVIFKIEDSSTAKSDFKHFLYSQSEKMISPIQVKASYDNISMAKYLISQLCFYLGISDDYVAKQNVFIVNGKPLTANSTYTAKTRAQSATNADKKRQIDNIIYDHLK